MTDFICPNCRGGFPAWDNMECPWCGTDYDGNYETMRQPITMFEESDDFINETKRDVRIPKPQTPDSSDDSVFRIPRTRNDGTTPCPDCGEPMPMVTWTGTKPKCKKCRRSQGSNISGDK